MIETMRNPADNIGSILMKFSKDITCIYSYPGVDSDQIGSFYMIIIILNINF